MVQKVYLSYERFAYHQGKANHTLFTKHSHDDKKSVLIVYAGDITITIDDTQVIVNLKKYLMAKFQVKDIRNLQYFLGMEVAQSKQGIYMSQEKYTLDLLTKTGIIGNKSTCTPSKWIWKCKRNQEDPLVDKGIYQRLASKLINLSFIRLDIVFALCVVSQFMHVLSQRHVDVVNHILS